MNRVPDNLLKFAYVGQGSEAAWPADEALKVIDWATRSQIAVIGIEVWLPTIPGPTIPTPFVYTHETRRGETESWDQFFDRSNAAAKDYIERFEWDEYDVKHQLKTPFFNMCLDDH